MKDLLSSPEQINQAPFNNSPSKQMYSFSKAIRFDPLMKASGKRSESLKLPSTLSKRSTSFGFGSKFDFTKIKKDVPAPNTYSKLGNINEYGKIGIGFGLGRAEVKLNGDFEFERIEPGPGSYDLFQKVKQRVKRKEQETTHEDVPKTRFNIGTPFLIFQTRNCVTGTTQVQGSTTSFQPLIKRAHTRYRRSRTFPR